MTDWFHNHLIFKFEIIELTIKMFWLFFTPYLNVFLCQCPCPSNLLRIRSGKNRIVINKMRKPYICAGLTEQTHQIRIETNKHRKIFLRLFVIVLHIPLLRVEILCTYIGWDLYFPLLFALPIQLYYSKAIFTRKIPIGRKKNLIFAFDRFLLITSSHKRKF